MDPSFLTGATLEQRYRVEQELGRGAAAVVYLATDLRHQRQVALKVLSPLLGAALGADRFTREIALLARMQHPHILPLFDSGNSNGVLYYVMPAVKGGSLRSKLEMEHALPADEAIRLAREIIDALAYAHEQGVVHRDIKPENVMLSNGHALVADFGIAHLLADDGHERLTQAGFSLGTPAYMSPEQATGDPVDGRSDVYAVACMLYEMLAGTPPFTGGSAQSIIVRHLTEAPAPLDAVTPGIPAGVCSVVAAALAKDPADRPSAGELLAALHLDGEERPVPAPPSSELATVVLDFRDLSADPANAWLGAGVAETVSVDITKLRGIRVIGRDRAAKAVEAAGAPTDDAAAAAIGRRLGARWVVWGSVQVAGSMLRLTPRVIDARDGSIRRADKIDGALTDLFALQDRIVTGLSNALSLELSPAQLERIGKPETGSITAYEFSVKGRTALYRFSPEGFREALEFFGRAVDADPGYAQAHSGLGAAWMFRYIATTANEDLAIAIRHLRRAAELDADLGEPHVWLTYACMRQHLFDESAAAGARALVLAPFDSHAHYFLGCLGAARGHMRYQRSGFADAVQYLVRAAELDPGYLAPYLLLSGVYLTTGQYDAARAALRLAVEIEHAPDPHAIRFIGAIPTAGVMEVRAGALDPGRELLQLARERYGKDPHVYAPVYLIMAYLGLGLLAEHEGSYETAVRQYTSAAELVQQHHRVLGSGYLLVAAELGIAAALNALGLITESTAHEQRARTLFERRTEFSFEWLMDRADGRTHYDVARVRARAGDLDGAIAALGRAESCAWADVVQLEADPAFARWRDESRIVALISRLQSGHRLPEPELTGRRRTISNA